MTEQYRVGSDDVVDEMALGLFQGERTHRVHDRDDGTRFSMTEVSAGPLSGPISTAIPDLTDSVDEFAVGLETAAEHQP